MAPSVARLSRGCLGGLEWERARRSRVSRYRGELPRRQRSLPALQGRSQAGRTPGSPLPRPAPHIRDTGDREPPRLDPPAEGVDGTC